VAGERRAKYDRTTMAIEIQVDCHSGYRGDEIPRRLRIAGRPVEVEDVLRSWTEPARRGFEVRGKDGRRYVVLHDPAADTWTLAGEASADAR
jgi:hypothetical protein